MKEVALFLCLSSIIPALADGQDRDQRIADLERKLTEAKGSIAALQKTIESLSAEMQALRKPDSRSALVAAPSPGPARSSAGHRARRDTA